MQNEKTCLSQPHRIKFDFPYRLKPPPYGCFVEILMSGDYDANRMLLVLILLLLSLPPSVLPILLLISTTAAIIPVLIDDALAVAVAVVEIFVGKVDVVALVVADSEESVNQSFPNDVGKQEDQIRNSSRARYLGVIWVIHSESLSSASSSSEPSSESSLSEPLSSKSSL